MKTALCTMKCVH